MGTRRADQDADHASSTEPSEGVLITAEQEEDHRPSSCDRPQAAPPVGLGSSRPAGARTPSGFPPRLSQMRSFQHDIDAELAGPGRSVPLHGSTEEDEYAMRTKVNLATNVSHATSIQTAGAARQILLVQTHKYPRIVRALHGVLGIGDQRLPLSDFPPRS